MHTPVTQDKFEELVASTTKYLQLLMDKTTDLEKRLASLESRKRTVKND
jgi:hypothetical protein